MCMYYVSEDRALINYTRLNCTQANKSVIKTHESKLNFSITFQLNYLLRQLMYSFFYVFKKPELNTIDL